MHDGEHFDSELTADDRYRLLVDAITDYAIYMLDAEGRVSSWNPGAERFKGYTADEIIGEHFSKFYTPEDRAAGRPEASLRAAAAKGNFELEGWRVRKDGTRFWAHVVIDTIRDADGRLIGYAKVTRDLTERRAAESALKASEQQFRLLVQGVTDYAIYMLDPNGDLTNWNAGAQRIKGYTAEEVIGRNFSMFYTAEDRAAGVPASGLETARRQGRWEHEGWRLRKDGSRFWAQVVLDAIRDDMGELIGFAKVTRDNTERRRAQQALEQTREALYQSQKMEAIGQLTGGVAHDFNNLLMAIMGSLELVAKRVPPDPRVTMLLDNAIQGAERGARLTQRMLAFARKQELRMQAVDLGALAEGLQGFMQQTLGPQIRIIVCPMSDLPPVRSDVGQLENALINLAVNARDAMPDGGDITISGRLVKGERPSIAVPIGDYVCLSFTDTGEGMDEETAAKAMEPFFTTKGVGKGTGLGLSMVHGLAAQSGGVLKLKSAPGEGSTFEIWLPVAERDAPFPQERVDGRPAPEPKRRLKVLAVDDDNLVLLNTGAMLEDMGHEVVMADTPEEALTFFEQDNAIDLVITDQAMPGLTGAQLAEHLRAARPAVPIIIATGYAELPEDVDPTLLRLAKPFTIGGLAAAVNAAVDPNGS
ncbi:MAG: PAS domain S-box protein [Caulobacteraceae bacterium]